MKDYSIGILQPGQTEEVNVFGNYIRNIGTGSIRVVARNTQKTVRAFSTVLGAGGWRRPESEYNHWTVTNNSSVAVAVGVSIGKGEAGESEIQINADVKTTPANLTKDQGSRFIASDSATSVTSYYSHLGLYNPPGSGIKTYVKKIKFNALNNLAHIKTMTQADHDLLGWFTSRKGKSKSIGGGTSKTLIESDFLSSVPIGSYWARGIIGDANGAYTDFDFEDSPIEIPEASGIVFAGSATNVGVSAILEFWEG
jgi:hypothetical protein